MSEIKELREEIAGLKSDMIEIKSIVIELQEQNDLLRKRISRMKAISTSTQDMRIKAQRVLGFTLSNVKGYYNAVRTVNGSQIRIYIGKNTEEQHVKNKIVDHILSNVNWLINSIKNCPELMEIPEISRRVEQYELEKLRAKLDPPKDQTKDIQNEENEENEPTVKVCGFTIRKEDQSYFARLQIKGKQYKFSTKGLGQGAVKLRIIDYLSDKPEHLKLYKERFPEYAAELGLDR